MLARWIILLTIVSAFPARGLELVADLSSHKIQISTGFSGTELLLFGAADGPGDIIVIVSGPDTKAVVRKKERVAGLWVNADSVEFLSVPSFFHVAATPNISASNMEAVLRTNGVGLRYQNMRAMENSDLERAAEFRDALIRRKEAAGLYTKEAGEIEFVGGVLFRTKISFPATVPTGFYRVNVYQVTDEWVQSVSSIPLEIAKVGLEEAIFRFANERPALYGLFAILVAALSGYGAGMLFGRR